MRQAGCDLLYVLQAGYNLLYGCWKYSWDADCELFLKILRGEVKEDVYVEQIQLQVLCMTMLPAGVTTIPCLLQLSHMHHDASEVMSLQYSAVCKPGERPRLHLLMTCCAAQMFTR